VCAPVLVLGPAAQTLRPAYHLEFDDEPDPAPCVDINRCGGITMMCVMGH